MDEYVDIVGSLRKEETDVYDFVDIPAWLESTDPPTPTLHEDGSLVWVHLGSEAKLYDVNVVKSVNILKYQYVGGHSPLVLPLPDPRLRVSANFSVFDHIISARGEYSLPHSHDELISAIRYADYIVDVPFISRVSNVLQLPRSKFMYSNPFDEFRKHIRNRFRQIMNGRTLRPPPRGDVCVKCGEVVQGSSGDTHLSCCFRRIHLECGVDDRQCPYCATTWELMNCFACSKPLCLRTRNRHITHRKYGSWTTECCGAQYHPDCTKEAIRSPCRVCGTQLTEMGFPVHEFTDVYHQLLFHNMKRRHDYLRRTLRSTYDNRDYLISLARPYAFNI